MSQTTSQKQRIKEALTRGRKLTAMDAFFEFGCMKLATRISELKREGFKVKSKTIVTESGKHVSLYQKG